MSAPFRFRHFNIEQSGAVHPVGTDSVLLGAWAPLDEPPTRILDIGTGTGVLALMLAQRSAAPIDAVEIHPHTADCAARNFEASPWSERLHLFRGAFQQFAQTCVARYDLIISNPPYFTETITAPDPGRRLARFAGELQPEALLKGVSGILAPKGRFAVITPPETGRKMLELGVLTGLYGNERVDVFSREGKPLERMLLLFSRDPVPFRRKAMVLMGPDGRRSPDFQALSADFYL